MSKNDWKNGYDDSEEIKEKTGYIPAWFSILFGGTVVFGIIYAIVLHGGGWTQEKQYQDEVKMAEKNQPVVTIGLSKEGVNPLRGKADAIEAGHKTYLATCAACHKPDATGLVGPNLKDAKWLHGGTDKEVYHVIMEGVSMEKALQKPPKGPMPPHKAQLGAKKVLEVMAWLAKINPNLKEK